MKYLETNSTDPYFNLAYEEWVLTHFGKGEYLILWQNDNTVVIGCNQNTLEEINASFVREHNINVVRRTTGGGAVYHDLGNLNFSFITDYDREKGTDMSAFTTLVVDALQGLSLPASASGRNDILVDGKKVSGTAQRIVKVNGTERILYHGTLLFRSNPDMIAGALNADPLKFASKATKSVRSRVGNIADYMPEGITLTDFRELMRQKLEKAGTSDETTLPGMEAVDISAVKELRESKYVRYDWNYGRSPKFQFENRKRFSGGTVDVRLNVKKGIIEDAAIFGDFLSLKPASELASATTGMPFESDRIREVLSCFEISDHLGSVTLDELLETMFI